MREKEGERGGDRGSVVLRHTTVTVTVTATCAHVVLVADYATLSMSQPLTDGLLTGLVGRFVCWYRRRVVEECHGRDGDEQRVRRINR
jgi:hypothetical protein